MKEVAVANSKWDRAESKKLLSDGFNCMKYKCSKWTKSKIQLSKNLLLDSVIPVITGGKSGDIGKIDSEVFL